MSSKCLFCKIRRKAKSVKCQFCDHYLESSAEMREGLAYLENGFARINEELDDLERKVHLVIGLIFKRHKYSADDLLDSAQMDRIKALAGKIKDDVNRWEAVGQLPYRLKTLYNEYAEEVHERLRGINKKIQERKPTLWEKIGGFFRSLYRSIMELLPLMLQKLLCYKRPKHIGMGL